MSLEGEQAEYAMHTENDSLKNLGEDFTQTTDEDFKLKSNEKFVEESESIDNEFQDESVYCLERIRIAPDLHELLKEYTKAAIRTYPHDLLNWSSEYFQSLIKEEEPKAKDCIGIVGPTPPRLTQTVLRKIHEKYRGFRKIQYDILKEIWHDYNLNMEELEDIWKSGKFSKSFAFWREFLVLALDRVSPNLSITMQRLCEFLTEDPQFGSAPIPYSIFRDSYRFLVSCRKYKIPREQMEAFLGYLVLKSQDQDGNIKPSNFSGMMCPPLAPPTDMSRLKQSEGSEESLLLEDTSEENMCVSTPSIQSLE